MSCESIIILGYKRSGTSLLRVILNSHPEIAIGPEMKFMQKLVKKYPANVDDFIKICEKEAADFQFSPEHLAAIYNKSHSANDIMFNWCNTYKTLTGKNIWGDKTPQNFKYLKMICQNFPDSFFIHIVRHPYDAMRSAKKRKQYHGIHTICGWLFSNLAVRHVKDKKYYFLRYEDFIKNPGYNISAILAKADVKQVDLLSLYEKKNHGRMAEGDSWNMPINSSQRKEPEILSLLDKLLIKSICFYYFRKYGYK